ncbi:hypothetical protein D1007_12232 [Hordeum vulgare]|nr:hypothetical protein D1007_12232 [Hordeum vulgare]
MAGGSSSKNSLVQKVSLQGAWLGSDVGEGHIEALHHHRVLPPASQVLVRLPSSETAPAPAAGEVVVFVELFYTGFGLPASSFFAEWLHFFGLQPPHLAPNAILYLATFMVLCEGFVGIEPRVDLWRSLFSSSSNPSPWRNPSCSRSLREPAPDVEVYEASEIEDEGVMEPRSDSSAGSEDPMESEGTEPSDEYTRPPIAYWTDDDEVASFCSGAAFEEDSDEVEEVTNPTLTHGRRQGGGATAPDEAAGKKGKGATVSRPASKRPAPGPPGGQVPVVAGEAEDADEDTASVAERAGWAAANAAQRELEIESKRRCDTATGKAAVGQPRPSRVERPVEKRAKARHDPSAHARA